MAFFHTMLALGVAFVLGTSIGFERQWRQRNAGLQTNVLVAVGAAAFSDLGLRLTGTEGRSVSSPLSCPGSASWAPASF